MRARVRTTLKERRREAAANLCVSLLFLSPAFVVLLDPDAPRLLALSLVLCV
jgi:hypothetical protein